MDRGLENIVGSKNRPEFKSEGERRIAYFLDDNSIKYQYEPGLLVSPVYDKPRIWYPDFYLPEFGAYIEYYGLKGKGSYDSGIKTKEKVYLKMGLAVIPMYPWTFGENWQGYIMEKLEQITSRRYRDLMKKPYWSQNRSRPFGGVVQSRSAYQTKPSRSY